MKNIIILVVCFFPILGFSQFESRFKEMEKVQNPDFNEYEKLVFDATSYIFSNPINPKSKDFTYAVKIAQFWMDRDTGFRMPTFGVFYETLTKENNQRFFYVIAMMHYNLIQKIEKGRLIIPIRIEGVKFSDLLEVKEVQYEGAKILLDYAENTENNFPLRNMQNYLTANRNGNLQELIFK